MNGYECIQASVDYLEENLREDIDIQVAANKACMSLSTYYRFFFAVVGCGVKEYIRQRRIHLAADDLISGGTGILHIAVQYGFQNADSFSRAFRKATGFLPSTFRNQNGRYRYERINIMEKYFDTDHADLDEKYPDIKILKESRPFHAAVFHAESRTPENDAFAGLKRWFDKNRISDLIPDYRVYGYDLPTLVKEDGTHGYEAAVTIPDDFDVVGEGVEKKFFEGGWYAVASTTAGNIAQTWRRFMSWLDMSRYEMGTHPYLEEHNTENGFVHRDTEHPENIRIDLYIPITKKHETKYRIKEIAPARVACYRDSGEDAEKVARKVWETMLSWARRNGLDSGRCHVYARNHGFRPVREYWHEVMVTLPADFVFADDLVQDKTFDGGKYLVYSTHLCSLASAWKKIGQYASAGHIPAGTHPWVEEWVLDNWGFPEKEIVVHYPIA